MEFNFDDGEELNDPLLAEDQSKQNTFIGKINMSLQTPLSDVISTPIPENGYESNYQNAALFCKDALHGRDIIRLISKHSKRIHTIYHNKFYVAFYILVTILLMLNALLETPSTIFPHRKEGLVSPYVASLIELVLLLVVTLDIRMQYTIENEGKVSFWALDKTLLISIVVVGLNWINLILRFIYPPIPHITRCLRPWFFIRRRRNVRNIGTGIVKTIPQVANIFFLLLVHLLFFTIFGKMLFSGIDDDNCTASMTSIVDHWNCSVYHPTSCSDYFATFGSSLLNLWTLYTTANFPDVMLPAYRCSPFYSLFFILFISSGIYFILNFLVGYIYSFYEAQNKANLLQAYDRIVCGLDAAFYTLCTTREVSDDEEDVDPDDKKNQVITRSDFTKLMSYFRPDMDPEHVSLIYDAGVGGINNKQMNITQFRLVMYNYGLLTITKKPSYLLNNDKDQDKCWGIRRYCRAFIENKYVVGFNDSTLLLYFLLVIGQLSIENESIALVVNKILSVMFYIFTFEYFCKVIAYGFVGYWNQGVNQKIETIVTPCSIIGTIIGYIADPQEAIIARTIIVLRLVRLVNVFKLSHQYQVFLSAFKQVINPMFRYILVLICVYYFYAIWGMEFFSNILVPTDPYVANSSYGVLNYYVNNFDNLARAFVTLFEQMVVNNWPIVMEGVVAATQNWVSRFFFILFYVSTVMITLNVITAFTLEVFNVVVDLENKKKPGDLEPRKMKAQIIENIAKERGIDLSSYNIKIPRWNLDLYTQIFQDALTKDIRQLEFGWHGDDTH